MRRRPCRAPAAPKPACPPSGSGSLRVARRRSQVAHHGRSRRRAPRTRSCICRRRRSRRPRRAGRRRAQVRRWLGETTCPTTEILGHGLQGRTVPRQPPGACLGRRATVRAERGAATRVASASCRAVLTGTTSSHEAALDGSISGRPFAVNTWRIASAMCSMLARSSLCFVTATAAAWATTACSSWSAAGEPGVLTRTTDGTASARSGERVAVSGGAPWAASAKAAAILRCSYARIRWLVLQ